ncbi:unnamed protein product [Discosporangium mesarthrocarpum]
MRAKLVAEPIPMFLENLQKVLEASGGLYFAGDKLSIADLAIATRMKWLTSGVLEGIPGTIVDAYPLLLSHMDRVMSEPKIVAYYEAKEKAT